jgi:tetraprenyl-beta-curcumene synthase
VSIPDPILREQALAALREKSANVDATGVFATLAPRRHRPAVVRAGTALQIAVDYLDSLSEDAGDDALEDGLRLHGALAAAVTHGTVRGDPYSSHPRGEDGGYLRALVTACGEALAVLPRIDECRAPLSAAIARCGEGQAYTHAAANGGPDTLKDWAESLGVSPEYNWWEVAAGASSSVAAHALIALAADDDDRAAATDTQRVDAAYFPSIGALTVLLDDLVDLEADLATGEHNYLSYFTGDQALAERIGSLADAAQAGIASLPRRGRHEAILAGVAGFYLAQPSARAPRWAASRERLLDSLGVPARVLTAFSRLRGRG